MCPIAVAPHGEAFIPADVDRWSWPEGSIVVAGIFIQFAPPALRTRLFESKQRALKPGGLLLLEGFRPEQLAYGTGGPPHADQLYTEPMLHAAFAGMEVLELSSHDSEIREGAGHAGVSALIDLVAPRLTSD